MPRSSGTRTKGDGHQAKGAGYGGPRQGAGWGGQARGASSSRLDAGEGGDAIRALRWDPANMADKEHAAAQMRGVLYGVALDGETEHARITAADKLLDRLEGKAVQKQEVVLERAIVSAEPMTEDEWLASRGVVPAVGAAEGSG